MTSLKKGLPIVDDGAREREERIRDRRDGVALTTAQKALDEARVDEALALLAALAEEPVTAIRGNASLLYAGVLLMVGRPADVLDVLARLPARPAYSLDEGYRKMIEAVALRQTRQYPEALAAARASVATGPSPGRLLVLADAEKHAGHLDDAARTLEELLTRDPSNATALAQLAGYRNLQGDLDEGARLFRAFEELADGGADALRNAAFVHATRGDVEATVQALARALVLEPEATRGYVADEIELERFRGDARFQAVVEG